MNNMDFLIQLLYPIYNRLISNRLTNDVPNSVSLTE